MFAYVYSIRHIEKRTFLFLCAALCAAGLLYGFFVQATVSNIVAQKVVEKEIQNLTSLLSDTESSYLARARTIDREYARSIGFHETKKEVFAPRKRLVRNTLTGF